VTTLTVMAANLKKANGVLPIIDIGLGTDEREVTDEQAIEILRKRTRLAELPADAIRGLTNLGIYARGTGVLKQQRGRVLVTQAWLDNALQILSERLVDENTKGSKARLKEIRGLAHEIANVAGVVIESQRVALDFEKVAAPTGRPEEVERPRNTGFSTGTVIAAQEVHVHEAKKGLPGNGDGV